MSHSSRSCAFRTAIIVVMSGVATADMSLISLHREARLVDSGSGDSGLDDSGYGSESGSGSGSGEDTDAPTATPTFPPTTSAPTPPAVGLPARNNDDDDDLSGGAIAGIVIAAAIVAAGVAVVATQMVRGWLLWFSSYATISFARKTSHRLQPLSTSRGKMAVLRARRERMCGPTTALARWLHLLSS